MSVLRRRGGVRYAALLVLCGSFHRVERLLVSTAFPAYIVSGFMARPDWAAALHETLVPSMPLTGDAVAIVTATIGTTLAPWVLSFMQSYAVDKKLRTEDLALERVDVITDTADAAVALQPLAGGRCRHALRRRTDRSIISRGLLPAAVDDVFAPLSTRSPRRSS